MQSGTRPPCTISLVPVALALPARLLHSPAHGLHVRRAQPRVAAEGRLCYNADRSGARSEAPAERIVRPPPVQLRPRTRTSPRRPVTLLAALLVALAVTRSQAAPPLIGPPDSRQAPAAPVQPSDVDLAPTVTEDPSPLAGAASAIAQSGTTLFIGRADGTVGVVRADGTGGRTVRAPEASGPVRAVSGDGSAVWWLAADATLYRVTLADRRTVRVSLDRDPGATCALVLWRDAVWLTGRGAPSVFDSHTGAPLSADRYLPAECRRGGVIRIAVSQDGSRATLMCVAARPEGGSSVTVWRASRGLGWAQVVPERLLSSSGAPTDLALALSPAEVVAVSSGTVYRVALGASEATAREVTIPAGDIVPASAQCVTATGSGVWWVQSGAVFHTSATSDRTDAYLPWNAEGMRVSALAADDEGAWVATTVGVRRIIADARTDAATGYDGFVRLPLLEAADRPSSAAGSLLAEAVSMWMGVPYVYGGASQGGTDCSGFVMNAFAAAGVQLPHGSRGLATAPGGMTVRDRLEYGDVLVFPGHCAIYVGNGMTAETVSGQNAVGISTIWRRRGAIVRRFLGVAPERPALTSRHRSAARQSAGSARRTSGRAGGSRGRVDLRNSMEDSHHGSDAGIRR